jgi:hypothetical protein
MANQSLPLTSSKTKICSVPVCDRSVIARGLCEPHYRRWRKFGDPGNTDIPRQLKAAECSVNGCITHPHSDGMCRKHYAGRFCKHSCSLGTGRIYLAKHGLSNTPEYEAWHSMKQRCDNPNHKYFVYYGGRGITYCSQWSDFTNFFADMGSRPSPEHTLERIDNDKGYAPDNCKWATMVEQNNNKRTRYSVVPKRKG